MGSSCEAAPYGFFLRSFLSCATQRKAPLPYLRGVKKEEEGQRNPSCFASDTKGNGAKELEVLPKSFLLVLAF